MNKQHKSDAQRGIEWTDYTWNPVGGCKHECRWTMPNGEIAICYAETVAERVAQAAYPHGFAHHYWHPDKLEEPLKLKAPSRIFLDSMSDLMGHWVSDEEIEAVLDVCRRAHWHTFQLLTKAAPRLRKFKFPANVWVGASVPPSFMMGKELSVQQQRKMLETTLSILAAIDVPVRWMSIEPLSFQVGDILDFAHREYGDLAWAVIGAASHGKQVFQPQPNLVRSAIHSLREQSAAVFFKGNLRGNPAAETWLEEFPAVNS